MRVRENARKQLLEPKESALSLRTEHTIGFDCGNANNANNAEHYLRFRLQLNYLFDVSNKLIIV